MRSLGPLAIDLMHRQEISDLIDKSPMNRGLSGADWLADDRNILVEDGDDRIMFDYERPGTYQFHWLTSSRGRKAIDRAKAALTHMFEEHGAEVVYGMVPVGRKDVRLMARLIGAKIVGPGWEDGEEFQVFVMTKETRQGVTVQ